MIASEEFRRQILGCDSLLAKRRFILLLSMDFKSRNVQDNDELSRLNRDELNTRIRHELSQYDIRESVEREV